MSRLYGGVNLNEVNPALGHAYSLLDKGAKRKVFLWMSHVPVTSVHFLTYSLYGLSLIFYAELRVV
jgi:hypothetical protein